MWFGVILYWHVEENLCFWFCIERLVVSHEETDSFAEVADLDGDIPQEGVAISSSYDNYCLWINFGWKDFHGKP